MAYPNMIPPIFQQNPVEDNSETYYDAIDIPPGELDETPVIEVSTPINARVIPNFTNVSGIMPTNAFDEDEFGVNPNLPLFGETPTLRRRLFNFLNRGFTWLSQRLNQPRNGSAEEIELTRLGGNDDDAEFLRQAIAARHLPSTARDFAFNYRTLDVDSEGQSVLSDVDTMESDETLNPLDNAFLSNSSSSGMSTGSMLGIASFLQSASMIAGQVQGQLAEDQIETAAGTSTYIPFKTVKPHKSETEKVLYDITYPFSMATHAKHDKFQNEFFKVFHYINEYGTPLIPIIGPLIETYRMGLQAGINHTEEQQLRENQAGNLPGSLGSISTDVSQYGGSSASNFY